MKYELLAKSKPQRSLQEHLTDTEEAARSIFCDRILENWCRFFKADLVLFLRLLRIASLFHDVGKANPEFQKMCRGSKIKQTLRHEWLSALILHLGSVREWLLTAKDVDFEVIVAAVLGHHMKADVTWADTCQTEVRQLTLNLNSKQIQSILNEIRHLLEIDLSPPKLPNTWDFNDRVWVAARKNAGLAGKKKFRDAIRRDASRRSLHLAVKAGVVAADTAASGLVREGHSIQEWLDNHLHKPRLMVEDIDRDILKAKYQEFEKRFGHPFGFDDLFEFQRNAQKLGDRALLRAGCGRGKTLAAYLWVRGVIRRGNYKIGRVLFLYPTRGTATEGFKDYVQAAPESDAGLFHGTSEYELEQLMESPEDSDYRTDPRLFALGLWGKRYLSATVDRFLAFLSFNYGSTVLLPMLADSAVVLDEVHAYDRRMFDLVVAFLKAFDIPVLCMTATLPEVRRMELENLGLELYPRDRSELKALAEEEERPRYYIQTCDRTTAMQKAIEAYRDGKRVLWVVNTVDRCQKTARELDEKLEGDSANVLCYHSRFKLVHRNQRHKEVVEAFKQSEKRAIAVTTQVCEMSLDLDADVLITELAPCSALVQRFGRSNRHGKLKYSEIFVYEPETEKPYTEELLDRAREFLTTVTNAQPHASQKLLAEQLEIYGERETLADGNAPFLTGGYFACSEPFRNIDNWTHDCVLEEDVKAAIERIEAKDAKWHELVLPVPNYVETQKPNDSQAKCLKYLRIAPSSKYCNKVGFQA
jgi:CRISPR-associated endonuclease/helicase Cas3